MKPTTHILGVALLAAAPVAAAPTQEDIDAREPADIEVPRGDVVEKVIPTPSDRDRTDTRDAADMGPVPDLSREMLDDIQAVIDSVRSKTAMPDEPLSHLASEASVHILPISGLEGHQAYHAQTLREVLRENHEIIADIRDQIRLNIFAMRALQDEGFAAEDVLTWETAGTDDVTIVVDDR